jgi:hypothetical protein
MAKKSTEKPEIDPHRKWVLRHLRTGWIGLLVFLSLGIFLEALHGLKLNVYLDVRNSTRRLMWTLSHAHGALFSLIHLAFACSLSALGNLLTISRCLIGAIVLLPLGFLLGGIWIFDGDPGPGILLVPVGATLLFIGVVRMVLLIR